MGRMIRSFVDVQDGVGNLVGDELSRSFSIEITFPSIDQHRWNVDLSEYLPVVGSRQACPAIDQRSRVLGTQCLAGFLSAACPRQVLFPGARIESEGSEFQHGLGKVLL